MVTDEIFMHRCLQLAANGRQNAKPNPMVGAVIVARGRIIGEGYHVRCGEAHAEVNAFASVKPHDECLLPEATLYVSLEPCAHYGKTPPCALLIIEKGVKRVVVGCVDPFAEVQGRGIQLLREAGIEVTVGVLREECERLNKTFFTFHRQQRPYIILKWAQSADGFIDRNGEAVALSTPFTKMLVHKLRSEVDAIIVGRITDEREHPRLDVRHWSGRSPRRLVIDHAHPLHLASLHAQRLQSLLVEGGCKTLQWFIDQGLWDELRIERTPIALGNGTPSPRLPQDIKITSTEYVDGNSIVHIRHLKD